MSSDARIQESGRDTLGSRLRTTRRRRGWTQRRLAEAAGTSQAAIQKMENGKSRTPRNIEVIAAALRVNPCWLLYGRQSLEELSPEALEVARAWSRLTEPHRSRLKRRILRAAGGAATGSSKSSDETRGTDKKGPARGSGRG